MPVSKLFVEGKLDAEILDAVFEGNPLITRGGTKYSLRPRAHDERSKNQPDFIVCYLRDRDFDFDPPADLSQPTVDRRLDDGTVLGWRWCRHEVESYLIDPALVSAARGWDVTVYTTQLVAAARAIRHYQIARWVIGTARRSLPPNHQLNTRPVELKDNEIRLPADLSDKATSSWAHGQLAGFYHQIQQVLDPVAVGASIASRLTGITEELLGSADGVLLWCSGKDLLAALEPWLQSQGVPNAGAFRAGMRDWVIAKPQEALDRLPEWNGLIQAVRS